MDLKKIAEDKYASKAKLAREVNIDDSTLSRYLDAPPRGAVDFIRLLLNLGLCPREYVNCESMEDYDCPSNSEEDKNG